MTAASVQGTDAVAHVRSIEAATSLYRAVPRRNSDGLTPLWHDHMWCVLRTGALLDEYEFTTIVVFAPLTERENHLEGEEEVPVQILMQAVEIAGSILQQNRGRPLLAAGVTELEKGFEVRRKLLWLSKVPHPLRGDRSQSSIECLAQFGHDARQRICEIFILAFAEAITRHLDATAE